MLPLAPHARLCRTNSIPSSSSLTCGLQLSSWQQGQGTTQLRPAKHQQPTYTHSDHFGKGNGGQEQLGPGVAQGPAQAQQQRGRIVDDGCKHRQGTG